MNNDALLSIKNLKVSFTGDYGVVKAVDDVEFYILKKIENVAFVGESGCGKSVTALSIMGLLQSPSKISVSGEIIFEGRISSSLAKESC